MVKAQKYRHDTLSQDTEAIALAYYQLLSKAAITVDLLLYKLSINLPCKLIIAI